MKGALMTKKLLNEKMMLISIIGTLETIKQGGLSVDEAEKFLFSPYMVRRLKEKQYNETIINIIEKGCELEDILSLLPEDFLEELEEMKQEALQEIKTYKELKEIFWI